MNQPAIARRALLAAAVPVAGAVHAQAFPDRPMRMLVGFAPGGTTDIVARVAAEAMGQDLGQPMAVENRGGAGGVPAALAMLQVSADGHVLMLQSGGLNQAEALGTPLPFDVVAAFAPVGLVGTSAISLVVHPSIPATNLAELRKHVRRSGRPLRVGSPGVSLTSHLYGQELGIEVEEIRYRGTGLVVNDLLAGRVDAYSIALPGILTHIRSGGLRAIAIASTTRSPVMPELATTVEQGFPGIISASWFGVVARAGTPPERLERLSQSVSKLLSDPMLRARLGEAGVDVAPETSPESFDRLIREDRARWDLVVQRGNLRL
ncbi:Bug family tripartite tricarboxylate transporter substrate binding protein [Sabulicella glaciei]|uniref:Tripartite tricarboxylate transporter substrate binding protein n=1 Tax=Sabulicella glaciei TaxID=2984948 RepID=A0ABT3NTU8_9PROT|nr:tripartite tricarboxylate transporter substrate binding protein [Roseococcus sp. MDT2-1-1]MCW8085586.1 tripartite tricarboxylate transporter substrate binding protein [Roseococcus sp. MDT2-1-1]